MNKNNQVAPMYQPQPQVVRVPGWGDDGRRIIDIGATRGRPVEAPVAMATNNPTEWKTALVAMTVVVLSFAMVSLCLWYFVGMPTWIVALMIIPIFMYAGYRIIIILNGDHVASQEVSKNERVAVKTLVSIDKEVAANERVTIAAINAQDKQNERLHQEAMTELTYGNKLAVMQEDMSWLQARVAQLMDASPGSVIPVRHNYVPNDDQEPLIAMEAWLSTLYLPMGGFNPDTVHGSGAIKASPWKNEWGNKTWAMNAKKVLTTGDFSPLKPIVRNGRAAGYELRYDKKVDAIGSISRG